MNGSDIRETMEQIHISKEMQERLIANLRQRTENRESDEARESNETRERGKSRVGNWKRMAATAAALVLAAGLIGIPAHALIQSMVEARMEEIPKAEVQDIMELVQGQKAEADSFSREYSSRENKRMRELLRFYENGVFPEQTICLVKDEGEAAERELYYIWETSTFCLPERELTDEELLEIIDFNHTRAYAISQSPAAQESHREYLEEREQKRERIREAGGISEEEAVEIAKSQMKAALGPDIGKDAEIHVAFLDISGADYAHKGDIAYMVIFSRLGDGSLYTCTLDSQDGDVLETSAVTKPE